MEDFGTILKYKLMNLVNSDVSSNLVASYIAGEFWGTVVTHKMLK